MKAQCSLEMTGTTQSMLRCTRENLHLLQHCLENIKSHDKIIFLCEDSVTGSNKLMAEQMFDLIHTILECIKFILNPPVLGVLVLKVVHVAACVLILGIAFLPFLRFTHVYQLSCIFHHKFSLREVPRCHNTTSLPLKIMDLEQMGIVY